MKRFEPGRFFMAQRAELALWPGAAVLAAVTVLVYLPAMRGGFIWDDDILVTENPAVKTLNGLFAIWFGNWQEDYIPLTLTSFWAEWHLWGMHAAGYHVVNIALHAANAVLVWRVLARLGVPGSWLAALLFAVHPVCASSVVWIAERKNTLSMLFYLLSLGWFLRHDESVHLTVRNGNARRAPWGASCNNERSSERGPLPGPLPASRGEGTGKSPDADCAMGRVLWCSVAAFALALLAKSSTVVLPAVLLLLVWWRRGRVTRGDLRRCIPFFALAVLMALAAGAIQARAVRGGVGVIHDALWVRLIGGSWAVWFYLWKIFAPTGLTMIYPRWGIDPRAAISYLPGVLLAGLMFVFWRRRRGWGRPFLFASGYFVVALAPALGLADLAFFSSSRVADHFQYLAVPGICALIAGLAWQTRRRSMEQAPAHEPDGSLLSPALPSTSVWRGGRRGARRVAAAPAAVLAVAVLAVLTWHHEGVLADGRRLWEDNLAKNPNSWKVCMNLHDVLAKEGKLEESVKYKERADELIKKTVMNQ
jgi:hypothetical protein